MKKLFHRFRGKGLILTGLIFLTNCHKHQSHVFTAPEDFVIFHHSDPYNMRPAFNADFLPTGHGVSVGERIRVTDDWGRNWQEVAIPSWADYSALVLNDDHTFYFGHAECYLADKSGTAFTELAPQSMTDLRMTAHSTLIAAGPDLFKSTNGGVTWEITYAHTGVSYIEQMDMIDSLLGFAWGGNMANYQSTGEIILKTNDGGNTWSPVYETSAMHIVCVDFVNAFQGYLLNSNGILYKTVNGGQQWTQQANLATMLTGGLGGQTAFVTAQQGYLWREFGNQLFVTHDGGQNWKLVFTADEGEAIARVKYLHGKVMILGLRGLVAWGE